MRKTFPARSHRPRLLALLALLLTSSAAAHLGEPTIKGLRFPPARTGEAWLIIDNVGLLVQTGDRWRWLCDEAMTPVPGFNDVAPLDAAGQIWVAATRAGLYRTTDGGCTFAPVVTDGPQYFDLLSPHPGRPGEALVVTQSIGEVQNDVYRTTDAGATWQAVGFAPPGRFRGLVRAVADPGVVYVVHTDGAARSDDGGQRFTPITLAPPPADPDVRPATGVDIELLATDPHDPQTVWSAFLRFPQSDLQRSRDGGATWEVVARFDDSPESLVIDPATGELLLAMPLDGLMRSADDGASWAPVFVPDPGAWFDCLTRAPDGALWACVRRGAPYLAADSADGEAWRGRFAADYTDIAGPWACPPETATARICAAACDRSRQDCTGEADGGIDAALPDAAIDGGPPDAEPDDVTLPRRGDACAASPGEAPSPLAPFALLGLLISRRRRKTGRG